MSTGVWTATAIQLRCPYCTASPGARCRTSSGSQASKPHRGRLIPAFVCPSCAHVNTNASNVAAMYCDVCGWWAEDTQHLGVQDGLDGL